MSSENSEVIEKDKKRIKKRPFIFLLTIVVLGLISGYLYQASKFEETDDAYIETLPVQVAPKVAGQIINVYVQDNQKVKSGDLIAEIDPTDYNVQMQQSIAKYDATLLKQKSAKATLSAANSRIELAQKDLQRYKNLYKDGAISKQELDKAQTKFDETSSDVTQATQDILSKSNNRVADAELKQLAAARRQAQLNLSYTKIYAPISGSITKKAIERGSYVQTGQSLLSIVPNEVWVVANYKENQLRNMRVNQPVEIKVDTYPDKIFKGRIESFQRISGAKSSLFPPENAVGSFVKIVQRIPVKIVFEEPIDPNKYTIVPGMSVEPKVRVK